MYHSITIGTDLFMLDPAVPTVSKNTWSDWHLIPATRPLVNPPTPKINRIEIPGADGSLDLTDTLTGRVTYGDRTGSWSFYVENDHQQWQELYSEIMAYLHGKELQCLLEDDPTYYYEGRFSVNEWRSDPYHSVITINYVLGPYKKYSLINGDNWAWDPFYFGDPDTPGDNGDMIRSYKNMRINSKTVPYTVTVTGDYQEVIPTIIVSGSNIIMIYNGTSYYLGKGTHVIDDVVLTEGTNTFQFKLQQQSTSTATVTLKISGGRL